LFSNALSGVTLCRYLRIFPYPDRIFANSEKKDQNELSRLGLELAEFIYTLAESRLASDNKEDIAIFRNITDIRLLTSEVMQELAGMLKLKSRIYLQFNF
jgi:hypothetical protein